jgi:predicted 3-demethylubiquinone-9 3-methyltransferase (glyoxalase superfamily)
MGSYLGGPDEEGRQRATQAMLAMKKIDLAAMKQAYLGN